MWHSGDLHPSSLASDPADSAVCKKWSRRKELEAEDLSSLVPHGLVLGKGAMHRGLEPQLGSHDHLCSSLDELTVERPMLGI